MHRAVKRQGLKRKMKENIHETLRPISEFKSKRSSVIFIKDFCFCTATLPRVTRKSIFQYGTVVN